MPRPSRRHCGTHPRPRPRSPAAADPSSGRNLADRLGERPPRAQHLGTAPPPLMPDDRDSRFSVREISRSGGHQPLHRGRDNPTRRAARRRLIRRFDVHHPPAELDSLDAPHRNSGQPEQQRRSLIHARGLSLVCCLSNSKTSRGHGPPNARRADKPRNRTLPGQVRRAANPQLTGRTQGWSFALSPDRLS
jgi:hypothetical protein